MLIQSGRLHMPGWTRPLCIPDAVPLTHADPPVAIAGEVGAWHLPFTLRAGGDGRGARDAALRRPE
jgi:hypothetical protein